MMGSPPQAVDRDIVFSRLRSSMREGSARVYVFERAYTRAGISGAMWMRVCVRDRACACACVPARV